MGSVVVHVVAEDDVWERLSGAAHVENEVVRRRIRSGACLTGRWFAGPCALYCVGVAVDDRAR